MEQHIDNNTDVHIGATLEAYLAQSNSPTARDNGILQGTKALVVTLTSVQIASSA